MTFGVALSITNPISSSYLAVIAAIKAWDKLADEIIILDGGSSDNSIDYLSQLVTEPSKLRIIANKQTYWGAGDGWHVEQLSVNLNLGLELLTTDWAYAFSSDYIPNNWQKELLEDELGKYESYYWVRTYVGKPINGRIVHKLNKRNIIINLKKIRLENIKIVYGIDENTNVPSDFPILPQEKSFFLDPINNYQKTIYRGVPLDTSACLSLECIAYGHFFYNIDEVEKKIKRWDLALSKFMGLAPARITYLKLWHKIFDSHIYCSKEEILLWEHPEQIKELIAKYYTLGMIGGIIDNRTPLNKRFERMLLILFQIEKKMRTFCLHKFKGVKSELDALTWNAFE